jgi:hypothetical protein
MKENQRTEATVTMVDGVIIGLQRSGTTLIRGMLGAHSRIFTSGELFLTMKTDYGKGLDIQDPVLLAEVFAWLKAGVPDGRQLWLKETTWEVENWPLYCAAAPRHKVVVIVRDWRDQFCSQAEQRWTTFSPKDILRQSTYFAGQFFRSLEAWRSRRPAIVIRYEDLVAHPRETLAPVMAHIGLDLEEQQLDPARWQIAGQGDPKMQRRRRDVHGESIGRWRQELPDIERYMHPKAVEINRRLGYD